MNLETLHKYKEDGLLRCQTHPTLPLTIWNYTEKVQYEKLWDEVTLSCRGLVTDDLGNVVARPFKKFFNMEEGMHTPTEDFEVYEKMDGSLGILFYYKGEWVYATRGSFTSEQAIHFKRIMESKYSKELDYTLYPDSTYLFEIIYPENRIVVDYGEEERLVLLGEIQTDIGDEMNIDVYYNTSSLDIVKRYDGIGDYSTLKKMIGDNAEGYVVRFSNGDRMKIKGEEYLRLHKIMTDISTTSIWEALKNGDDILELLKDVPDEFYERINTYVNELQVQHMMIEDEYIQIYSLISMFNEVGRPEFAKRAKMFKYPHLLFRILDNKDVKKCIWDIIKPEYKRI